MNRFRTKVLRRSLEPLESRCMLSVAPVAVDDAFDILEDQNLAVTGFDFSADFEVGSPSQVLSTGATWDYLDQIQNSLGSSDTYPTDGSSVAWTDPSFDISTSSVGPWSSGATPLVSGGIDAAPGAPDLLFGIGDAAGGLNLITTYLFRTTINVNAADAAFTFATANLLCDDGCIVYINGIQSFSSNLESNNWDPAGPLTTETFTGVSSNETYTLVPFDLTNVNWHEGVNTIAVEVHQDDSGSSDIGFDLELILGDNPTDEFSYSDDVFATASPEKATGQHTETEGNPTGAIMVDIGRRPNNNRDASSAGWSREFSISSPLTVQVDLDYRLFFDGQYEGSEYGEAILEIDGVRYGTAENNSLHHFTGNGNGGNDDDTLWQSATFQVPLSAGSHTITVGAFNNRSTANNEMTLAWFDNILITPIGGSVVSGVLENDTDADDDPLTVFLVDDVSNGSLTLNSDGTFVYLPNANFNGIDTFTYRANDGDQDSNLATVIINIAVVNDPPIALFKNYDAIEDITLVVDAANGLLIDATDADNPFGDLTAVEIDPPDNGSLTLNPDGSFSYTPNLDYNGIDTFRFAVSDGTDQSNDVTVTLNIAEFNDPPTVLDDTYTVEENTTLTAGQSSTTEEQVLLAAGSTWKFLDNGSDQGTAWRTTAYDDSFWTQENDLINNQGAEYGFGDGDEQTTVSFGPDAQNKFITTYFRTTFQVDDLNAITDLNLALLRDDGAAVFINGQPGPIDNLAVGAQFNTFALDAIGLTDESTFFNFNLNTALLVQGENLITVEIHQANPGSSDISFDLELTATLTHFNTHVLINDSDPEGDSFTAMLMQDVSNGSLLLQPDGTFVYTPNSHFEGIDTFTYVANDGNSNSTEATVTITVTPGPNDIPIANDDSYSVNEEITLVVDTIAAGVLDNDTDGESEPLTATVETQPSNGSVVLNSNGTFSYTPDPDFFGNDTFTYRAYDGSDFSTPAIVTITVNPLDDPPVAVSDRYFVEPDSSLNVSALLGVLANDIDVDLDPLTAGLGVTTTQGLLSLNSDGSFSYTPTIGFLGDDTFTYRANDSDDDSNLTTVTLTVDGQPVADDESYDVDEDQTLVVVIEVSVLQGDTDPENDPLTASLITAPANGSVSLSSNGTFTYTPNPDFSGTDSFTYVANDGDQNSVPATVTINVAPINDAPVATDDVYSVVENNVLIVDANSGVLENDSDIDSGLLTATLAPDSDVQFGTLALAADGSFIYSPNSNYFGQDTFTYVANDGTLDSAPKVVTIEVITASKSVMINEIMYHPSSENDAEEYIELINLSLGPVDLTGWQFSKGIDFTFPNISILASDTLVIAVDVAAFTAKYPLVTNVIGGWVGRLSNSSEEIELKDETGLRVDRVTYADEGDWALRRPGPNDRGHTGWDWVALHDGGGSSLELINPEVSNRRGQNWLASVVANGTPGASNSVANNDTAPLVWNVAHSPAVPTSSDTVTVVANLADSESDVITAVVMYRQSTFTPGAFLSAAMFDDGQHGDGEAGDGLFAAILPAQTDSTVVEFYVQATDGNGNIRTWPGPTDASGTQGANLLYQVDDSANSSDQPTYLLIMTALENEEFKVANFDTRSNAQMNATLINVDGTGIDIRYNVGVRIRGSGSRNRAVVNNRINIPNDRPWQGITAINLNAQFTHSQLIGMTLFDAAGLSFEAPIAVQLRHNGENRAVQAQVQFGSFVRLEVTDSDFTANHFPNDPNGNFYSGNARLEYLGENESSYVNSYLKKTNNSQADYSDVVALTRALDTNQTPNGIFVETVKQVIDVGQWMRFFAVNALLVNEENGLINGAGDDYSMYRGVIDPRFQLVPHDMDTVLNQGDTGASSSRNIFEVRNNPRIDRLFDQPEFLDLYYYHLKDLSETVFSAAQLNPMLDNVLGGFVDASTIQNMKNFAAARVSFVLGQLPGAGVNVPPVAFIDGEPVGTTPLDSITLNISGNDITQYQFSINGGPWLGDISVAIPITMSGLADGTYTISVIGRNSKGVLQDQNDASISKTWTVDSNYSALQISEVLADNHSIGHEGTFPDMIELVNTSASNIDLTDLQIFDSSDPTGAFVFPLGSSIDAGERLVLHANDADGTTGIHLGFSLDRDGEGVYLFAADNTLLDSVEFGLQLPDLSIARDAQFIWQLSTPSFGAVNVPVVLGDPSTLKINEWLAEGDRLFKEDRLEIYNSDVNPVALGNFYLTDNLGGNRDKHNITPLSYIAGSGYTVFFADENSNDGADHLNFKLSANRESIALLTEDLQLLDHVIFGPQANDISAGRQTDGDPIYAKFSPPTFGLSNSAGDQLPDALGLLDGLRITELMYHPLGDRDLEFIELQNIGLTTLNLENVKLADGINFTFGDIDLEPGAYIVVVKNRTLFEGRYGTSLPVAGVYSSRLSNGGENIKLQLPTPFDGNILNFTYQDSWYPTTDGDGPSLVIVDPAGDISWDKAAGWQASSNALGSPGTEGGVLIGDLNLDNIVNELDLAIILQNYGTASNATYFQGDLDADGKVALSDLLIYKKNFGNVGSAPVLVGDLNQDNIVDQLDLAIILQNFGTASNATYLQGDLDNDGKVALSDLLLLKKNFDNTASAPVLVGDFNQDNIVDQLDLAILLQNYGTASNATYLQGDLDNDGKVALSDLLLLKKNFGNTASAPQAAAALTIVIDSTQLDSIPTAENSVSDTSVAINLTAVKIRSVKQRAVDQVLVQLDETTIRPPLARHASTRRTTRLTATRNKPNDTALQLVSNELGLISSTHQAQKLRRARSHQR